MNKSARTLKAITLSEGRVMTMSSQSTIEKSAHLCDHCAASEPVGKFESCWVNRSSTDSLKKVGVYQPVLYCAMHQPILAFRRPLQGFDTTFNTLRPGLAWSKRLLPKDVVGLMDETGDLFGKAQVVSVDSGLIADMIDRHGQLNHLVLNDNTIDLRSVLLRLHGPQVIHNATQVSVITMQRL